MWVLGSRLTRAGLVVRYFNYSTTRDPFERSVERLRQEITALGVNEVNLVAHSLGGLVSVAASRQLHGVSGTIVALGTPFGGSSAGRWLSKNRVGSVALGSAASAINNAMVDQSIPAGWKCGVIAGTRGIGLGRITRELSVPHDGTVAVAETFMPAAEHITLPVSHTGLVLSGAVAEVVARFLKSGKLSD